MLFWVQPRASSQAVVILYHNCELDGFPSKIKALWVGLGAPVLSTMAGHILHLAVPVKEVDTGNGHLLLLADMLQAWLEF